MAKGNDKKTYTPEDKDISSKSSVLEDQLIDGLDDKYADSVQKLIDIGKEKGYLLYDEVSDLLPPDIGASAEDLDDLFSAFGTAGIEVIAAADQNFAALDKIPGAKKSDGEATEEGVELDLTPGTMDKANDPVRMYLREMGTVPLLTRAGEVEIAKRIERGKLAVIKSISRTPTVAKNIMTMGDLLRTGERTIRELVIFQDEEITDERVEERAKEVLKQIDAVKKAWVEYKKREAKLLDTAKRPVAPYRRAWWKAMRARVVLSQLIRKIEFT